MEITNDSRGGEKKQTSFVMGQDEVPLNERGGWVAVEISAKLQSCTDAPE